MALTDLLEKIDAMLNGDVTTKADIETLVNLTLALSIGQVRNWGKLCHLVRSVGVLLYMIIS